MEKLRLLSYTDPKYSQRHMGELSLFINPASIKIDKSIVYHKDHQAGATNGSGSFERYKPEKLSFNIMLDCTGILDNTLATDNTVAQVARIEQHLYCYDTEGHRPSYVVVAYGDILFKGQLEMMNTTYQLINSNGRPLRANIDLAFAGFMSNDEQKKKFSKLSPDMSRLVTIKDGDTLPSLCDRIYGNSLLASQVARFNSLNSFRNIAPGTEILLPHMKKN